MDPSKLLQATSEVFDPLCRVMPSVAHKQAQSGDERAQLLHSKRPKGQLPGVVEATGQPPPGSSGLEDLLRPGAKMRLSGTRIDGLAARASVRRLAAEQQQL